MDSILYSVITLLLLTGGVLLLMHEYNKKTPLSEINEQAPQLTPLSKEEGEDHFSTLMNAITPEWYWRVNHEYIDFFASDD